MPDYQLIRSKRRSLALKVLEDGVVQVRAPLRVSAALVQQFVDNHRQWIYEQQQRQAARPRQQWHDGADFAFGGDTLQLDLAAGRRLICRDGPYLTVRLRQPDEPAVVRDAVIAWLRDQAREAFQESIERQFPWFASRGHSLPVLRVKKMRTRWGSLSQRGYINLNMALIQYPPAALDYVVMHELCHLEQMNHGAAFHALMDQQMPDWRERERLLRAPHKAL